jgi:hypothetical protein
MKPFTPLLATALLAASLAATAASTNSANPLTRTGKQPSFLGGGFGQGPFNASTGIGRPSGRYGAVTPVPEPSEWVMMMAGLGVVGFMARRFARRPDGDAQ